VDLFGRQSADETNPPVAGSVDNLYQEFHGVQFWGKSRANTLRSSNRALGPRAPSQCTSQARWSARLHRADEIP
jgi:hypothetical protein